MKTQRGNFDAALDVLMDPEQPRFLLGAKYTSPHSLVSLGLYVNELWNFGSVLSFSGGPTEVNDYLTQTTLTCHMNIARGSREPET